MRYSSSFTYDLHIGEYAESWTKELFSNAKVEVKTDSLAHKTGNAFIEVYSRGKQSGISTTEAEYWVYRIESSGSAIVIPVTRLKELVKKYHQLNGFAKGGDDNTSLGVLVPLIDMIL